MRRSLFFSFVASAAFLVTHLCLGAGIGLAETAGEKPCYQCHPSKITGTYLHGPVGDKECTPCHNSSGGDHRIQKGLYNVKAKGSQLCYECHENLASLKSVHGPIQEGDCVGCHAPHVSPYKKMLRTPGNKLCFQCHDGKPFKKKFPHAPVDTGSCLDCHVPHQSKVAKLIKPSETLICYECHDKALATGKSVHTPVSSGECTGCHVVHGADNEKLLKTGVTSETKSSKLCYECHDNLATQKSVHDPVRKGDCTGCHTPHSSPYGKLLKSDDSKICFQCHFQQAYMKKFPHQPVSSGNCLYCHLPHQSKAAKLLKSTEALICFDCHDKGMATGKSVHMPVSSGECEGCHAVHGSDNAKLLKAKFPAGINVTYNDAEYALCFTCHDSKSMTEKESTSTGFRDGKQNLHFSHANGQNISCRACHEFHASPQTKLLKDKHHEAGKPDITLNFTETPTGGTCTTSCHDALGYAR